MKRLSLIGLCVAAFVAAQAQPFTNFEPPYTGSPGGTPLTGQQGWYLPAGSTHYNVHTYAGNVFGFASNPLGASQFIAGLKDTPGSFARGEKLFDFSAGGIWTVFYDTSGHYAGVPGAAANNLGSFSLQPSAATGKHFIMLSLWMQEDPTLPVNDQLWRQGFVAWGPTDPPGSATWTFTELVPEFNNLDAREWYRVGASWDFTTNRLLGLMITNLRTGVTRVAPLTEDFFLVGGPANTDPLPTATRFFTGGGTGEADGNVFAADNLNLHRGIVFWPDMVSLFRGIALSGGVVHLIESDNARMVVRPGLVLGGAEPPIQYIVEGTSMVADANNGFTVSVEGHASSVNIQQTISLFNWNTNLFEQLDVRAAPTTDTLVEVNVSGNATRFINQTDGKVRARVTYRAVGPVIGFPWQSRLDMVRFRVNP